MLLPLRSYTREETWQHANRRVLWGWKRDGSRGRQRVIFLLGHLERTSARQVKLEEWCFYYRHQADAAAIADLGRFLSDTEVTRHLGSPRCLPCADPDSAVLEVCGGPAQAQAATLIARLCQLRPYPTLPRPPARKPVSERFDFREWTPVALYAGSGLSYEAGLPTLAAVHEAFGVDSMKRGAFTLGAEDPIPQRLRDHLPATMACFVELNVRAIDAQPSRSHHLLARLVAGGSITRVLTDNVDDLFASCGVDFERTRTLFCDARRVDFGPNTQTLLVIGVAADRRWIIAQAREQGLRVVVVNPLAPVSPRAQNLTYLRPEDIWYRCTAEEFFRSYVTGTSASTSTSGMLE